MEQLKYSLLLFTLISFSSCNNEDTETDLSRLSGFYQIESIVSSDSVDLNGDSQKSVDLKTEFNDYFNEYSSDYDLEIRPNSTNDTEFKLISVYFPEPYMSFDYPGHPDGYVEFAKNGIGFQYEFENNEFELMPSESEFVQIDSFSITDGAQVQSTISKWYYDFAIQDWREVVIDIVYVRFSQ